MRGKHGNGNGHGKSLAIEAQRLLPTPRATDGTKGGPNQRGSSGDLMLPSAIQPANLLPNPTRRDHKGRNQRDDNTCLPGAVNDYGQYAPAIQRWEHLSPRLARRANPCTATQSRRERRLPAAGRTRAADSAR